MIPHSFVARNFAHLYVVGGRQHSMDAVAKMHDYGMKLWQESIHMLLRQSPRIVLGAELIALEKKGTIFTEN